MHVNHRNPSSKELVSCSFTVKIKRTLNANVSKPQNPTLWYQPYFVHIFALLQMQQQFLYVKVSVSTNGVMRCDLYSRTEFPFLMFHFLIYRFLPPNWSIFFFSTCHPSLSTSISCWFCLFRPSPCLFRFCGLVFGFSFVSCKMIECHNYHYRSRNGSLFPKLCLSQFNYNVQIIVFFPPTKTPTQGHLGWVGASTAWAASVAEFVSWQLEIRCAPIVRFRLKGTNHSQHTQRV